MVTAALVLGILLILIVPAVPTFNSQPATTVTRHDVRASLQTAAPNARRTTGFPSLSGTPTWQNITGETVVPPGRDAAASAYDPTDGFTLFFGGWDTYPSTKYFGDTWEYKNGAWTNLTSTLSTSPAPRAFASMAYDQADGYFVLFGGQGASADFGDTWKFASGQWTEISSTSLLGTGAYGSMTYDSADGYVLLFGGYWSHGCVTTYCHETWKFSGGTWSPIPVTQWPPGRQDAVMTYDSEDGYTLLFGGENGSIGSPTDLGDTWKFLGGSWTNLTPSLSTFPHARFWANLADDQADGYVLLYGGCSSSCNVIYYDTWDFKAGNWVNLTSAAGNVGSNRASDGMVYDSANHLVTLMGGDPILGEYPWKYSVPSLTSVSVSPTLSSLTTGALRSFTATPTCSPTCPSTGMTYTWSLNSNDGNISTTSGISTTFTAGNSGGVANLTVSATLNGASMSASALITIIAINSVIVSPRLAPLVSGGTQIFTANPTCSSTCPSWITYTWSLSNNDGNISTTSGISTTFTAGNSGGVLNLTLTATMNGTSRSAYATINVTAISSVTVSPATQSVASGDTQTFTTTPTCNSLVCPSGTTYSWALSNNAMGTLNSTTGSKVVFTAGNTAGTVTLFVNATLNGKTVKSSVTITITTASSSAPFSSGTTLLVLVLAVVVLVAVIVVLLLISKRKKTKAPQSQGPAPVNVPPQQPPATFSPVPSSQASPTGPTPTVSSVPPPSAVTTPPPPIAATVPSPPATTPPFPPTGGTTKACIMCGKDIPGIARFCPHCKQPQQ